MVRLPSHVAFCAFLAVTVVSFSAPLPILAQDDAGTKDAEAQKEPRGYQLQPLDEPALPFEPVTARTPEQQQELTAQAWLMTGGLYERRDEFRKALIVYQKALETATNKLPIYRALINVSLRLGNAADASNYTAKAVELDPDNFEMLRQLGIEMVKQRKLDQAIKYLEQARTSDRLQKNTGFFVLINRDLGILYSGLGENAKAADCYEVILTALLNPAKFGLDPRTRDDLQKHSATSFERIGQVLLRDNRSDLALKALEKARAGQKGKPGSINYLLAQIYEQKEEHASALEELENFFDAKLTLGRGPFLLLARILEKLNKSDSLTERLETLSRNDPRNSDLQFFLASQYASNDRLEEAEAIYRRSLEDKPSSEAYLGLAKIYRQQNKARELLDNLGNALSRSNEIGALAQEFEVELKAIEEDEKLLATMIEIVREDTREGASGAQYAKIFVVAQLSSRVKKIDDAVAFYRLALKANPTQASIILRRIAELQMEEDQYAEAAETYKEAVNNPLLQGDRPNNMLFLAFAQEMAGNTDEALATINDLKQLVGQKIAIIDFREAWIYYHSHRLEKAVEMFDTFLTEHAESDSLARQAKFSLSAIYVQLGETRKGEEILEKFLAENPDDPGVNNDLGYLYADQGKNLEKARSMIQKAVDAEPENGAYLDSLGWVLFKLGEFEEATRWLIKASKTRSGEDSTIWDHLGDCQHGMKDIANARESWTKALKLEKAEAHPDEKLVKQIEEKLKLHTTEAGATRTEKSDDPK